MADTYAAIRETVLRWLRRMIGVITYSLPSVPRYHEEQQIERWSEAMCLAIPMQVKSIDQFQCLCEAKGIERDVSLFMLQGVEIAPGDFVLVHVGYAIQKISAVDAAESWELLDQILAEPA